MPPSGPHSGLLRARLPLQVPRDRAPDALVQVHLRCEAQLARRHRLVCTRERHVSHLVWQLVDDGLLAHVLLDSRDKLVQCVRGATPQIHHQPGVNPVDRADHPVHNVVDVGELAHGRPVAVLVDWLVVVDGVDELEGCHVWPPPRPINREEAEHRDVELVQVMEGVTKELAAPLRRSIRAYGGVAPLVLAEGCGGVLAVDTAAGGGHNVLHAKVPAVLEDVDRAHDVRGDVAVEVLDRIAHPCLGCQVAHDVGLLVLEDLPEGVLVTDVKDVDGELAGSRLLSCSAQDVQAIELDRVIVISIEVVDGNHAVAPSQEPLRSVPANEARGAGDKDALLLCHGGL
mmetsp:Transcript_107392/g.321140  ORF Transcript_107392/g.321140 Transcript_107392/m.321140 type:complete len:343 (-) Transcript_107392:52-1080(-)